MTDLALTAPDAAPEKPRSRKMLLLALPLVAALAGGASSYLGFWSPLSLLGLGGTAPAAAGHADHAEGAPAAEPVVAFVDLPPINVTLPDARVRMLHLVVKLETDEASRGEVEHLLPRVSDAFNTFLTGIAPQGFERRGILEVIRDELTTRARAAIGDGIPVEVLVTEFALK